MHYSVQGGDRFLLCRIFFGSTCANYAYSIGPRRTSADSSKRKSSRYSTCLIVAQSEAGVGIEYLSNGGHRCPEEVPVLAVGGERPPAALAILKEDALLQIQPEDSTARTSGDKHEAPQAKPRLHYFI